MRIPLTKFPGATAHVDLDDAMRVHVRRYFKQPWVIERADVLAVVDMRVEHPELADAVMARLPEAYNLWTKSQYHEPNVGVIFRRPVRLPPRRLVSGDIPLLKSRSKAGLHADTIHLTTKDPDAALAAFEAWGVPRTDDPMAMLAQQIGVVADPEEAARVEAGYKRTWQKAAASRRRWLIGFLLLVYLRPFVEEDTAYGEIAVRALAVFAFGAAFVGMLRDRAQRRKPLVLVIEFAVVAVVLGAVAWRLDGIEGAVAGLLFYGWLGAGAYLMDDVMDEPE